MAEDQLIAALTVVARRATAQLNVALRPLGLTASNYYLILKMADRGEMTLLFRRIHLSPSNVSRRLAQLIAAGFVTKTRLSADRRNWWVALTAKGRAVIPALKAALAAANQHIFNRLSPAEQAQLGAVLTKLSE